MRSPFHFIVEPVGGSRYDNVKSIGGIDFITSSSKEDHKASNRHAKVLATPIGYTGDVMPGDTVIVQFSRSKGEFGYKELTENCGPSVSANVPVSQPNLTPL